MRRTRHLPSAILLTATFAICSCSAGAPEQDADEKTTGNAEPSGGSTAHAGSGGATTEAGGGMAIGPDSGGFGPSGSGGEPGSRAAGGALAPASGGQDAGGGSWGQAGGSTAAGGSPGSGGSASEDCQIPVPSSSPIDYGKNTTGGGNAAPVTVSSFAEAETVLSAYRDAFKDGAQSALVIVYDGRFDYGTISDVCAQHDKEAQILQIKEMDNVTFRGTSGSSANFGIKINRAHNVIVQNMTMGLLPGGGDSDAISIEGNGTNGDVENVWIDHNELFSSTKSDCEGAGDTEFDGLIDVKKGARRITISYNYLHDHQKTGLLGYSDSDDTERYVTFHHNWYENVVSRTPLQRFGYVHLFNNYYDHILSSGINVRMGGLALIEANYFEDAANPVTSRYSDVVGYWDLRDNFVGPNITWTVESDTLANADDWMSTKSYPESELDYSYEVDPASCVKRIVSATAGARL